MTTDIVTDQLSVIGDKYGEGRLWTGNGTFFRRREDHEDVVCAVEISANTVISSGTGGHVRVWRIESSHVT